MNIGLDARSIFSPKPRGTGRNLFDAYHRVPELRPAWRFTLYHQRAASECPLVAAPAGSGQGTGRPNRNWSGNVRTRQLTMPGDRFDAWFQVRLPLAAWRDGIDLLHFPANAAPAWCPVPFVVTVHDLIPLKVAGELPPRARRSFYRGLARGARRAVHVITPSQATREDLCEQFGVAADRVTVIPWAPDGAILDHTSATPRPVGRGRGRAQSCDDLRRRYELTKPWLLNFSGSARRKNAAGLIAALAELSPELRSRYQVVLIGCSSAAVRAELQTLAERLGVASQCRILGFVPHEDLPGLLRGARALLMPSLYEGFGLPVLDAFACGVPVLASNASSLPEVAADAAVYCDPTCPRSIADGIARVLREDVSASLACKGRQRVRDYTWERTARAMVAVYERCLAAAPRFSRACEVTRCR